MIATSDGQQFDSEYEFSVAHMNRDTATGIETVPDLDTPHMNEDIDPRMRNFSPVYPGVDRPLSRELPGGQGGTIPTIPSQENIFNGKSPEFGT